MDEQIKYLDHEVVMSLLNSMGLLRDRLAFNLIYFFGLRVSELVNMTLDDIDLENNTIKIMPLKRGKLNKFIFPIDDDEIINLLKKWIAGRPESIDNKLIVAKSYKDNRPIYKGISRQSLHKAFRKYCKAHDIDEKYRHPHALRHSIAVHCATQGMDIYEAKVFLRHKRLSSTEGYYDISSSQRDDSIRKLHKNMRA